MWTAQPDVLQDPIKMWYEINLHSQETSKQHTQILAKWVKVAFRPQLITRGSARSLCIPVYFSSCSSYGGRTPKQNILYKPKGFRDRRKFIQQALRAGFWGTPHMWRMSQENCHTRWECCRRVSWHSSLPRSRVVGDVGVPDGEWGNSQTGGGGG